MHKVMALDVGTKRIGIALSDYLQVIATPHSFISRVPEEKAIEAIVKIAKEYIDSVGGFEKFAEWGLIWLIELSTQLQIIAI